MLSSNIVKREIASVQDVEEALARQSLYGGDLVTNLLELARVSEESLTRAMAESVGLEPAPPGELPPAQERVRRLVPGDIAHRYALYPLAETGGRLVVAVSEPLPGEVASDLEFSLGLTLEQRAAPLVRIQQAVSRDYGVDLDHRVARVLARLNGAPDPHPTEPPLRVDPSLHPTPPAPAPAQDLESVSDSSAALDSEKREAPADSTASAEERRPQRETLVVPPEPRHTTLVAPPVTAETLVAPPVPPAAAETLAPPAPAETLAPPVPADALVVPPASAETLAPPAELEEPEPEPADSQERAPTELKTPEPAPEPAPPSSSSSTEAEAPSSDSPARTAATSSDAPPPHSEERLTIPAEPEPPEPKGAAAPSLAPSLPAPDSSSPSLPAPDSSPSLSPPSLSPRPSAASLPKLDLAAIARAEARANRRHRRRLGPYTPAMAEADLSRAESLDDVMSAFFDFAAQYFEYSALFAVHGDLAEGRDAHGTGASRTRVLAIGVPLDLPSSLSAATAPNEPYRLARLSASGLDGALAKDLERRPGKTVLLLPVRVRERAVLVLYGDHGANDVELETVGDLLSFTPLVSSHLERLIRQRKGAAPPPRLTTTSLRTGHTGERPRVYPNAHERAQNLATALAEAPLAPVARISGTPVISIGPKRAATPPPFGVGSVPPAPVLAAPEMASFAAAPAERRSATPVQMPPPVISGSPAESRPPLLKSSDSARKLELVREVDSVPPELSVEEAPVDSSLEALLAEHASIPVLQQSQSRSVALAAHSLHPEGHTEELRLPSVIVDLANDTEELVAKLVAGEPGAAERLIAIGAAAVPALVGAFPGPILSELRRAIGDGPARASECGPLLKVLARIGPKAAPVLGVRTNDSLADVRAWATRLLGEMPCSDASRAVARRFVDEDPEVRRAALAAGRMLESHPAASEALASTLAEMLLDPARKAAQIHMLIEAVADLREARAIPALAALLASGTNEIQRSAHWALTVLARTDYADNAAAWDQWWRINTSRHRIEWLIDALMHENADIRRGAGDELKSVTKEYFGYYDDLPARERERAQRRYREWWETKGKARFVKPTS